MARISKWICVVVLLVTGLPACGSSPLAPPVETTPEFQYANIVTDLDFTQDGQLLLATGSGVFRWDPATNTHKKYAQIYAQQLATTSDGSVWAGGTLGAEPAGLYRFDGHAWSTVQPDVAINSLSAGPDGSLWVGVDSYAGQDFSGIMHFDGQQWKRLSLSPASHAVIQAPDGTVWAGAICMHVFQYKDGTWTNYAVPKFHDCTFELGYLGIRSLAAAPDNAVWMGTRDGIRRYKDGFWSFTRQDGLPSDNVGPIAVTSDNQVWAGTDQGIAHFDGRTWRTYTTADGLASNMINVVRVAPDGTLWAGTAQGFSHFDGKSWQSYAIRE